MTDPVLIALITDPVLIALIVGLPLIITAVGNLIVALLNRKQSLKNTELAVGAANKLDIVHGQINGKMEQLLKTTGAEERAVGEAIGRGKELAERQGRVVEAERVEDRAADKQKP